MAANIGILFLVSKVVKSHMVMRSKEDWVFNLVLIQELVHIGQTKQYVDV